MARRVADDDDIVLDKSRTAQARGSNIARRDERAAGASDGAEIVRRQVRADGCLYSGAPMFAATDQYIGPKQ